MNSTFEERTEKTQKKKGKKASGGMVETRTQKASKNSKHKSWKKKSIRTTDENWTGRRTERNGNRRL